MPYSHRFNILPDISQLLASSSPDLKFIPIMIEDETVIDAHIEVSISISIDVFLMCSNIFS
jgi:hypothetical protein